MQTDEPEDIAEQTALEADQDAEEVIAGEDEQAPDAND